MKDIPYDLLASYFAKECSQEEIDKVENWRDVNPENKSAFDDFAVIWKKSVDNNDFMPDIESALNKVSQKIQVENTSAKSPTLPRKILNSYYRVAAIIFISIGVGLGYIFMKNHATIEIATLENDKQEIVLADGSTIWLNSSSLLKYPRKFKNDKRTVFLMGEAFFEITKDAERPFTVESDKSITRVTGTSFNVKTSEKEVVVTVEEGTVLVSTKVKETETVALNAREKAVVDIQKESVSKQKNDDMNFTAWKTGKLLFKNTPLPVAVKTLKDYYQKEMEIVAGSDIDTLTLTTSFDNNSLEEVIRIIELGLKIEIEEENEKLIFQ